jgi:hypothetical protein
MTYALAYVKDLISENSPREYVRLAAGGETVLVTDRDRGVAEIGPPGPGRSPLLSDALLVDAFRQGWMTPPILVGSGPPKRKPVMTSRNCRVERGPASPVASQMGLFPHFV